MKKTIYIHVFLVPIAYIILCSCNTSQKVNFHPVKGGTNVKMEIPKGAKLTRTASANEDEFIYRYADSPLVYVSTFSGGSVNYDVIRGQGTYYDLFNAEKSQDTLTLSGIDSTGLYWKNITIGEVHIGYKYVPKYKKILFDSALKTMRKY